MRIGLGIAAVLLTVACGKQNVGELKDFTKFDLNQRLQDFHHITGIVEENYAMLEYKESKFSFKWEDVKASYNAKIREEITREEFTALMQEMVANFRDGHTSAMTYRDAFADGMQIKAATLGFSTKRSVTSTGDNIVVDQIFTKFSDLPVKAGDIILSINDKEVDTILKDEIIRYHNTGHAEANRTLAAYYLTKRWNILFANLPTGKAMVKVKRGSDEHLLRMDWVKVGAADMQVPASSTSEKAKLYPQEILEVKQDGSFVFRMGKTFKPMVEVLQSAPKSLRHRLMARMDLDLFSAGSEPGKDYPSDFQKIEAEDLEFQLVGTPKGLAAVYRVEDFMWSRFKCGEPTTVGMVTVTLCKALMGDDYAKAFEKLKTLGVKKLILDLRSNGGGFLHLGYELVRAFTKAPVAVNESRVRLTEDWLGSYKMYMDYISNPVTKEAYRKIYETLLADAKAGKRLSSKVNIMGSDYIHGTEKAWDSQVTILIDEMCASMCDIFTTLMQDHKLGQAYGKQSMGAGGSVMSFDMSPRTKIALSQTVSIMYRMDGSVIENVGAKPDTVAKTTTGSDFWNAVKAL